MIPKAEYDRSRIRRMAWDMTHPLDRPESVATTLNVLRWGMLLTATAPEWAMQVLREDAEMHKRDGRWPGTVDECIEHWRNEMRAAWIERFPIAAFGGETE